MNRIHKYLSNNKHGIQYLPVVLTIIIGIIISFLVFYVVRNSEEQRIKLDFKRISEDQVSVLKSGIEANLLVVESLGGLYMASIKVERNEFHVFVKPFLSHLPGIQALEWIPRVHDSKRDEFEDAARLEGFPGFQITERKTQGNMVRAAQREEYFPVYFVEPLKGNEAALGFDLASNKTRLEALNRSRETGKMVATSRITLVQEVGKQFGFLAFFPIYDRGSTTQFSKERRENLKGFVLGVFRIGEILEQSLTHMGPQNVDIYLYDESARTDERFLYSHSVRTCKKPVVFDNTDEEALGVGLHHAETLNVVGRKWLVLCVPTAGFIANSRSRVPWGILLFGLLFTGILTIYFATNISRTKALRTSNEHIKKEIIDRKQVEKKLLKKTHELGERVKELRCLYRIVDLSGKQEIEFNDLMQEITNLISLGWQSPDIICARITLGRKEFTTDNFKNTTRKIEAPIEVNQERIGMVEVCYLAEKSESNEAPFLKEEEALLKAVSQRLGNIIERQQMELELEQARKLESIGQLAAGIAHEINTPIQYVSDNVIFLKDAFDDIFDLHGKQSRLLDAVMSDHIVSEEMVKAVETASKKADMTYMKEEIPKAIAQSLDGTERVSKIVHAMKEFSHPGGSDIENSDVNEAILNTITVARNEWKYVAEMNTDLDSSLSTVPCLISEINQVILNLIINAAHAIGDAIRDGHTDKGNIVVSTRHNGEWAEISVGDTGLGIPKDIRDRVFDPFFTTKEIGKGTGQGLAIARNVIVKKHHGELRFETEEGKGTTFIIRLPITEAMKINEGIDS